MSRLFDVNKLIDKYGIDNPPMDPLHNETVQAILAGGSSNVDNWRLCDPTRNPVMYARITDAWHELHRVKPERERERGAPELFERNVREFEWLKGCNIKMADRCEGLVTDLPISFGGLTMIFKCCQACRAKAAEATQTGLVLSVLAAYQAARAATPPVEP